MNFKLNSEKIDQYFKSLSYLTLFLIAFAFFIAMIVANTDLSAARYMLFMDELITFDFTKTFYKSSSLQEFWTNFSYGHDLRYGRAMFNLLALVSYIPNFLLGEQGIIIASRMTQALLIILSCLLFSCIFVKNYILRILLFCTLMLLPFSAYYMSMPKPEPLLMLILAFFFYYYQKEEFKVGRSFILLGAAFGLKISTLPIVLLCIFISIILSGHKQIKTYKDLFMNFLLGFSLVNPLFLPYFIIASMCFYLLKKLEQRFFISIHKFNPVALYTLIFAGILGLIATSSAFNTWVNWTFKLTGHGTDSDEINIFSWLSYIHTTFFSNKLYLSVSVLLLLLGLLVSFIPPFLRKGLYCKNRNEYLLIIVGVGLILPILLFAKRLWGFYLYGGTVLLCVGVFALFSTLNYKKKKLQTIMSGLLCALLVFTAYTLWLPSFNAEVSKLSSRTKSEHFQSQDAIYQEIIAYLDTYDFQKHAKIIYNPSLFLPNNTDNYTIVRYWGPFTNWEQKNEVIILRRLFITTPNIKTSPNYERALQEEADYNQYVIEEGETCKEKFCYQKVKELKDGSMILELVAQ